ncbi:MAG: chromate transporter [Mogibacterium sp.]|nr:chromate transporter [Mogibacterium sp.]
MFFKLGAFTIGGGIAMLPLLQNTLINDKKWFTKEEFMDIVAVCQSLPGVVAINMATYVGFKKKGLMGSVVSTFGVVIPSFTMILIIAKFITTLGDNSVLMGAMAGLRAAALGMVVVAMIQLLPAAIKNKWALLAAVTAFILIAVLRVNTAYVILLFAVIGIAVAFAGSRKAAKDEGGESE